MFNWRIAKESNPHGFPVITVFKAVYHPRSETILIGGILGNRTLRTILAKDRRPLGT